MRVLNYGYYLLNKVNIEIFRLSRAQFIYQEAKRNKQDPQMAVYLWMMNKCGADDDTARRWATSPRLKDKI